MNIAEQIEKLIKLKERHEQLSDAKSEVYKELQELELALVQYAKEQMLTKLEVNNRIVTINDEAVYSFAGGELTNPQNKTEIVNELVECGYLDEADVVRFEGANVHATKLKKAFGKMDTSRLAKLIEEKKIGVFMKPIVKIK